MLQAMVLQFIVEHICLARFMSSIEVGNAGCGWSGGGHSDGQDDLWTQRCIAYLMGVVLCVPEYP